VQEQLRVLLYEVQRLVLHSKDAVGELRLLHSKDVVGELRLYCIQRTLSVS